MSDTKDWACKEVAYRETTYNETPGMSGTCDWALKEAPKLKKRQVLLKFFEYNTVCVELS
jgi:hypothetical protein